MSEYAICGCCYQRLGAVNELEAEVETLREAAQAVCDERAALTSHPARDNAGAVVAAQKKLSKLLEEQK
jgi:hypothetical protein